jgi:hypothetical protein
LPTNSKKINHLFAIIQEHSKSNMTNNNINSNMKHRTLVTSIRQSQEQAIRKSKASSGQGGCTHGCSSVVKFGIDDDDDEKEKKSDATSNNTSESSGSGSGSGNVGSVASLMSKEQAMINIKASSGLTGGHNDSSVLSTCSSVSLGFL